MTYEIKMKSLKDKNLINKEKTNLSSSKYPALIRDIVLLVEPGTKIVKVMNLINAAGGPLISNVDLLDMYENRETLNGKKSLIFRIFYQVGSRALTDEEADVLQDKIIKALEEEGGWEVKR
ncbi:MAG: hypothetical protein U9P63_03480 [Patescibacteria group bacterium]|nr:hypothetical protein [Patescibacteria group bacterium]